MPSLPVPSVVENTICALNEKIHALRMQRPTEHPLTEDEAKDLSNDIKRAISECMGEAFQTIAITDRRKLRQNLSLACHPDKLQSSQPELYANLATIKAGNVSYDLMNCPQQEINEIHNNNPLGRLFNAFDSGRNYPASNQHASGTASAKDKKNHQFFDFITGILKLSIILSQHSDRYNEPWRAIVKILHKIIRAIMALVALLIIYAAIIITAYGLIIESTVLLLPILIPMSAFFAVGLEFALLYLFTNNEEERQSIHETMDAKDNFSTERVRLMFDVIYNSFSNPLPDDFTNPIYSCLFRLLQLVAAPILLATVVYMDIVRFIMLSAVELFFLPLAVFELSGVILFNLPLYLFDGFEYIQKTSKAWFSPSSQENESPSDTAEDNNEQNVSPDSLTCHDLVSSPSADTQQNTLDAKPVSSVSPLSRCSVFANTLSTRQDADIDLNQKVNHGPS